MVCGIMMPELNLNVLAKYPEALWARSNKFIQSETIFLYEGY